jgi:hypothetical protein
MASLLWGKSGELHQDNSFKMMGCQIEQIPLLYGLVSDSIFLSILKRLSSQPPAFETAKLASVVLNDLVALHIRSLQPLKQRSLYLPSVDCLEFLFGTQEQGRSGAGHSAGTYPA